MYDKYYEMYMRNLVTYESLEKLVKAGLLIQEGLEKMVADRLEKFGY